MFFLPDNLFSGNNGITFVAEECRAAFGAELQLLMAYRAKRFHVELVVRGITIALHTEKPHLFRQKFLLHFLTAITA
jgi:hypothetical protein